MPEEPRSLSTSQLSLPVPEELKDTVTLTSVSAFTEFLSTFISPVANWARSRAVWLLLSVHHAALSK